MKILRKIAITISLTLLVGVLSGATVFGIVTRGARLQAKKLALPENQIEVFDQNNAPVLYRSAQKSDTFSLAELPEKVKLAFVDTEDKRFYRHNGFDFKRIVKATLTNLKTRSFKEGASTISQQLVKNTHLTQEKTLRRKLREIRLTAQLERRYSKDEILEKYLNTIYFGHDCFGISAAANFYFRKSPADLTLSDGAILAGLVCSPNNYSPFRNPENCQKRKSTVLRLMHAQKHITKSELCEALDTPLPIRSGNTDFGSSYFSRVFDELETISDKKSVTKGKNIQIYTYFDEPLQRRLEELASASQTDKTYCVLDVNTHGFKGYYSTVGEIKRLPGSLIKPLLVYAPALENDLISPATPVLDEKISFSGYEPKNYDDRYAGYISVRQCLANSVNIPAVKILNETGIQKSVDYLKKLNLAVPEEDYSLALALGGMKKGFTLTSLTNAYAAFPCGGEFESAGFIREIKVDGKPAYRKNVKKARVFSEDTAYLTTDMLKTAAQTGTAKKLRTLNLPIAAKTGTCGTKNGNYDAYSLSYTTRDCVGVWMGNADNSPITTTGGGIPTNVIAKINEYLYATSPPSDFPKPETVKQVELDKSEYYDTHNIVLADENSPPEYRFFELFKNRLIPTVKSERFSAPQLNFRQISVEENKVKIELEKPPFAELEIELVRIDYDRHTTVYKGKWTSEVIDENVKKDTSYVYQITPIYKDIRGKETLSPRVYIGENAPFIEAQPPPEITQKDWWNY